MTIIYQHGTNGSSARRCDASCHKAREGTKCRCVCGGKYHGVGSSEVAQEMLFMDAMNESFRVPSGRTLTLAEWETV